MGEVEVGAALAQLGVAPAAVEVPARDVVGEALEALTPAKLPLKIGAGAVGRVLLRKFGAGRGGGSAVRARPIRL